MMAVGVYDQIKTAFQDIIAPELHSLRADIQRLDQKVDGVDARLTVKIDGLRTEMVSMKGELLAEIRRLDVRIDSVDRELRTAIDVRERLAALEARRPS
ncbi:MAG: hypothetical protein ACREJG_00025 [Candidatus Rokuibacteriota bacterium]